jgi:hypothetical protein
VERSSARSSSKWSALCLSATQTRVRLTCFDLGRPELDRPEAGGWTTNPRYIRDLRAGAIIVIRTECVLRAIPSSL